MKFTSKMVVATEALTIHDEVLLADLAETRGCPFDEEEAAYTRSFADVGYTEHLMALER